MTNPKITLTLGNNTNEAATGSFLIVLDSPAPTGGLIVNFTTSGTATINTDYTLNAGTNLTAVTTTSFTVAQGQTSATLNLNALADNISEGNETVNLTLANGTGYTFDAPALSFDTKTDYATGLYPTSVSVGDFNNDGKTDLAVANFDSSTVSVLLRNSANTGFDTKTDYATGARPYSVSVGDFNNDGKTDLAVANSNDNTVSVLTNSSILSTTLSIANVDNFAPTGAVTISDSTPTQEQILTVSNTLTDADGLGIISYVWLVAGLQVAVGDTYTVDIADIGKVIQVSASYTDGKGKLETVQSAITSAVVTNNVAPTGNATAVLANGTEDVNYKINPSDLLLGFNDDDSALAIIGLKATHGKVSTSAGGYVFKPELNYNGAVTLTYKVSDGIATPLSASLSFNLSAVNDAPTGKATAILINGTEDTAYTLKTSDLIQGFNDMDGNALNVTNLSVNHGTLNGLVFTPDNNYNGVVNLSYSVSDGTLSSLAVQSFVLNKVNDVPTGSLAIVGSSNNSAIVGQTLTAGLGTLADVDGLGTLSYSWAIAGTNVSNTNSYSITSNDIGKTLTLTGRYTDMQGTLETTNTSVIISKSPAVSLNALDGLMTAENNGIDNSVSLAKAIHIAVKLDTQPLRDVTVNFVSSDISEGIITNASLTFTSLNWNTAQTLTISGVNDNENDGNIPYQITASISSDDVNYRQLSINPINLVNNDDGRDTALTLSGDANGVPKNDVLIGMDGADKLYGLLLADDLSGGLGNDTIYGGYDDDFLYGSEGNDYLWGEQDNDKLMGENGNDTLDGGTGLDTLMGGAGNDTYYLGYDAVDVITDNGLTTDIDTVIMPYLMSSYSKVKLS